MNFEGKPKSPIENIRSRINPEIKENVVSVLENAEEIYQKMQEKRMTELHLAQILIQNGFIPDFIQNFLNHGVEYFFESDVGKQNIEKIKSLIENFDFDKDGENTLILDEQA